MSPRHRKLQSEIDILTALGFGPDTLLSNEPKILIDGRFLSALLPELEDELEREGARRALFQIGLLYGLQDAQRIVGGDSPHAMHGQGTAESPLLALSIAKHPDSKTPGSLEFVGCWPERFEAEAHLSKLGTSETPACALSAGYTSGWLSGTFDCDILVVEVECASCGHEQCSFVAREVSSWQESGDPSALALLPGVPVQAFRDLSTSFSPPHPAQVEAANPLDFDPSVVHIWGPVMVLPFSDVDEALDAVDRLGREPETCDVRVVVVDLRGEHIDEGFGAAALEQILEQIEAWGAEALLTNISPLAEDVVSEFESRYLLLRKDLPEAVAAAFQIAEAQRHLL